MDQVKIGRFIQMTRKEQKMTQREVAERLNISDKTVSKWETGNGLPEVGLLLPLCNLLGISVNELLSGERLDEKQYYKRAEENIMNLMKEKEEAKKKIILTVLTIIPCILAGVTIILLAGLVELSVWVRILLIGIAFVVIASGLTVACILDREAGVYECKHCGERFVPDMKGYIMGAHTLTLRKLKCPKCGQKSYCKRHLSR
ncbi:MAG: helix-turn-helix transcriptional regulator [Clostridia bacterium]|nr:helix-turn-helix transcriptional regulator [Clostridia bacterium]